MDVLDLARWQFGITTVYHFIFVPLTIGLSPLVAIMQTAWVRTGNERWLRLTKFFGKLLLINFAIGVATGIVQEFQFGMNWSEYSRFVGDVFGAPLAMEALAAFFVESTFLGLWIFGWDRLPKKIHLACIWAVAIATNLSAFFILAANSWMQHPVGTTYNFETGRAEMTDIVAVLTNPTVLAAFPHTIAAAFLTAGTFVAGIAAWWMVRLVRRGDTAKARDVYRPAVILGLVTMLVSGAGVALTGDWQAKLMFDQQPAKMAAAEGLCETQDGAAFSILAIGDLTNDCDGVKHLIELPGFTSFLATGDFNARIRGVDELQEHYTQWVTQWEQDNGVEATFDPADTRFYPNLAVTYWSFRLMIGFGVGSAALSLAALWLLRRKGSVTGKPWFGRLGIAAIATPFLASAFGWIFTEMGRQPWVVAPNPNSSGVDGVWLLTARGVSEVVSPGMVWFSMIGFTLLYGVLAVVWFRLMKRYAVEGVADTEHDPSPDNPDNAPDADGTDRPLSFAY
ncbi:MAG: cytochrome ubiquinol oxidase subunit I [Cellulomonas iranensis]|uniref:Cytochrome d ubiquinol oxidase subunit I n=1 Tax=Cellulomonas iranensis TaxID=76862 RepID=A0ABU0GPU0_9CELL|nr:MULTISPECIES: cytochrome ubiquinol oxidase subunit I [Cellulomonas]MBO9570365.1 cytochrome ubiquinol oxidase subunit I [Cellulomonas iranensis]MDQ0426592.1 cytochrome d ubiquinol oxidase subunit I [Cellulomonas iranensis]TFH74237.1 cytochrome ubiquinol oxidase subunit I [Cellulomonas sp. HD19AZ1]UCN15988.1 cytochrome ubiquinol oxidase subunit I [Cellulomonas iranensis]